MRRTLMDYSICSGCGHDEGKCSVNELYRRAKELISFKKKATVALLQRDLKISCIKSTEISDRLASEGLVGPANGANPRTVNI